MSKFDWNKPRKIITVHGKDVDTTIIAGCFRYTMSRLNVTCKGYPEEQNFRSMW